MKIWVIRNIKNIFIHIRTSLKVIFLIIVSAILVFGLISIFYKITYSVGLGEKRCRIKVAIGLQ